MFNVSKSTPLKLITTMLLTSG